MLELINELRGDPTNIELRGVYADWLELDADMPLHAAAVRAGNYLMVAAKYGDRATARVELADAIRAVRNVYASSGDYLGFNNGVIVRIRPTVELWREAGPSLVAAFPINRVGFECDDTVNPEHVDTGFCWREKGRYDFYKSSIPVEWFDRLAGGTRIGKIWPIRYYDTRGAAYRDLSQAAIGWAIDANR